MSTKTLDATGLALADELAELVRDAIAEARDEDVVRPEIDALERYDEWRAQSEDEALPELSESQKAEYDFWNSCIEKNSGTLSDRCIRAADRLERELHGPRERLAELEPVIAHLRADARERSR